ncbi:MAG: hypothetical protein ACI85O_000396 [Saprospiraceae bacterium]|jgi:hypothetical protein
MQPPKYYLLFIVFIFANCTPKTVQKIPTSNENKTENPVVLFPKIERESSHILPETILEAKNQIIASIKTTPCYGKCPVFEIRFSKSQYVTWRGYANTSRIGFYEARIEGKMLKEIERRAEALGLFELEETYPVKGEFLEDYPAVITHIYSGDREMRIFNVYDAPNAVRLFEEYLIGLTKKLTWSEIDEVD